MSIHAEVAILEGVSLNTAIGTTAEIQYEGFRSGSIAIPTGSSITTLTWWGAVKSSKKSTGGAVVAPTFLAAQDSSGTAVTQTVAAAKTYPLPVALLGYAAIKAVVNAAGSVDVVLKT